MRMMLAIALATGAVACERSPRAPAPPPTRVEPVVDVLHGIEIADPYRWLEDQAGEETRRWIEAQNDYADRILASAADVRAAFRERLTELQDTADVGRPRRAGASEVFTLRRAGEPTAAIVARPAPSDGEGPDDETGDEETSPDDPANTHDPDPTLEYEVLVDPLALRPDGTTSVGIVSVSPDHRVLLYSIRDGGPDEIEIRALDLEAREPLEDRLPPALYGGGILWAEDSAAFLYVHRDRVRGPRVRLHTLGTDTADDREIFGEGVGPRSFVSVSRIGDNRWLLFSVQHGWARNELFVSSVAADGLLPAADPRPLVTGIDAHFRVREIDDELYVFTDHDAPRGRLMRVDLEAALESGGATAVGLGEGWTEAIPESDEVLRGFVRTPTGWVVTTLRDATSRVRLLNDDGAPTREIEIPPLSTASIAGGGESPVRLTLTGFDRPPTGYEIDLDTGALTETDSPELEIDQAGFEVDQRWATAPDGTRVPYFVVQRPGTANDGANRTLLNGYGGFNVASTPRFSTAAIAWVEAGGVWAHAILRGGGEFGEEWHRGGWLGNKQRVFDDFIAVAADLVATGVTSADRLAIRGGSNGGLLVGAALTQRPELFAAVLCGVPDLDMVRFFTFGDTNNKPALLEYGDASIPEQFEFLRRYSPYQAVQPDTDYPAILISTGDLDTRVPPLQGRKFAARLQAATTSGRPVALRYDPRRGHAGGRTRQRAIDDTAVDLAFAWHYTRGRR